MKALEKVLIAILALLILFVGAAYLLPAQWQASRSIVISAPPTSIHPLVENFRRWPEWSPWSAQIDPSLKYVYSGAPEGKGATQSWNGNKTGSGTMTITQSDVNKGIEYSLTFSGENQATQGAISYEAQDGKTKVIWSSSGELGNNPISRYFGLFMNPMIGADFERGLTQLKAAVEHGTQP